MNTSVGAMYNDLQGLGVDVAELKLNHDYTRSNDDLCISTPSQVWPN